MARKQKPKHRAKVAVLVHEPSIYSDTNLAAMYPLTEAQIVRVPKEAKCPACARTVWSGGAPTMAEMPIICRCSRPFTVTDVLRLIGAAA